MPITPRLRDALREHSATYRLQTYAGARSPWVFHHPYRRRRSRAGERIGSLRRAFGNAVTRAELPAGFLQHDLRHRRVTTWLAEGKSAVLVKEAMGHADLRTTMAYTHLVRENLRVLVETADERPKPADQLQGLVSCISGSCHRKESLSTSLGPPLRPWAYSVRCGKSPKR